MLRRIQESYFYAPVVSPIYRALRRRWRCRICSGSEVQCPLCERQFRCWVDHDATGECPHCGSYARHRLLWLFLQANRDKLSRWTNVLYFAPDPCLEWLRRHEPQINCLTTDLCGREADVHADITRLPFASTTFDAVICSHVLEHVPDDARAMRELFRVLKRGGDAIIQVPLNRARLTEEDPAETDPEVRERRFGQFDHVRRYGCDIVSRLTAAGFAAELLAPLEHSNPAIARRYGLFDDMICVCSKPTIDALTPIEPKVQLPGRVLDPAAVAAPA